MKNYWSYSKVVDWLILILFLLLSSTVFSNTPEFDGNSIEYVCPPDELVTNSNGFFQFTYNNFETTWVRPFFNYHSYPVKFTSARLEYNGMSNNYEIQCVYRSENGTITRIDIDIYEKHKVAGALPGKWENTSDLFSCPAFNGNSNITQSDCRFLLLQEITCPWC